MTGWRLIADGCPMERAVLLTNGLWVFVGVFYPYEDADDDNLSFSYGEWFSLDDDHSSMAKCSSRPTHWMALPELPTTAKIREVLASQQGTPS